MTSISRLFLIASMLICSVPPLLSGVTDEDDIEFAMQNPFLRELFRDRELRIAFGPFDRPSRRVMMPRITDDRNDFMLEMRIDQMVRIFLRKVIEEKRDLQTAMDTTRQAGIELAHAPSGRTGEASQRLRQSLEDLADRASGLRSTLASVISDLPEKAHYEPEVGADSKGDGYRTEIEFLTEQTRNAWERVNAFFFRPGATVTVTALKGDDMMVSLHKIQLMANKLAESVPAR